MSPGGRRAVAKQMLPVPAECRIHRCSLAAIARIGGQQVWQLQRRKAHRGRRWAAGGSCNTAQALRQLYMHGPRQAAATRSGALLPR